MRGRRETVNAVLGVASVTDNEFLTMIVSTAVKNAGHYFTVKKMECDVVVIGGGAAGLAAVGELARKGARVILCEARDRLGGRILTVRPRGWERPVELGAEFIHEGNAELWRIVRRHLRTQRVPPRHWQFGGDLLQRMDDVAERIVGVTKRIDEKRIGKCSFGEFLRKHRAKIPAADANIAAGFVEGFEAAPTDQMSARAVAGATLNDEKQFLLPDGYDQVVTLLTEALPTDRVHVFREHAVRSVQWRRAAVVVRTRGASPLLITARAVIVTLPLGVLQAKSSQRGAVKFEPRLRAKEKILRRMRMGHVIRLVLRFDARLWKRLLPETLRRAGGSRFGFIHSRIEGVPVWWSLHADSILTGWAGGPAALALRGRSRCGIFEKALSSLARLLKTKKSALRAAVRGWEMHNWSRDPFSRGAYSFTALGADDAAEHLREPVGGTLFFAGEATADGEDVGTVHGAISSGIRAAREAGAALKNLKKTGTVR